MDHHVNCLDTAICEELNDIARKYKWHVITKINSILSTNIDEYSTYVLVNYDDLSVHITSNARLTLELSLAKFIKELQKGPSQFICNINDYAFYANYDGLTVGCMHINMQQLQQIYKVLQQFDFKGEPDGT